MSIKKATLAGGMIAVVILTGLTGCNLLSVEQINTPNATEVVHTAVAIMTSQAATLIVIPSQPVITPEPEVSTPTAGFPSISAETASLRAPSPTAGCELVSPGTPLDVTIPDDTRLEPGETFTKIWRLVNSGSCTWNDGYAVVWFSGDELGVAAEQKLPSSISPGKSFDVDVEMVAPEKPGVYSSYWMLRSDRGVFFGLGPSGDAPFWVRIQVVAVNTATPTATVAPTATPRVEVSGEIDLAIGQAIDLDSGSSVRGEADDVRLGLSDSTQVILEPINNARIGIYGMLEPAEVDCRGAILADEPISLGGLETGVYLCYRSNQGLPGVIQLIELPIQNGSLKLNYLTWAAP